MEIFFLRNAKVFVDLRELNHISLTSDGGKEKKVLLLDYLHKSFLKINMHDLLTSIEIPLI